MSSPSVPEHRGSDQTHGQSEATAAPSTPTSGPWEVYDQGENDGPEYGCFIRSTTDKDADWLAGDIHNRADARLMASSPDLFEALRITTELLRVIYQVALSGMLRNKGTYDEQEWTAVRNHVSHRMTANRIVLESAEMRGEK